MIDMFYTIIYAVICLLLVIIIDLLLQKFCQKKFSILSKEKIRMVVSYFIGIFMFLLFIRIIF